jgi:deoxyribodipyrimidine photolyase-related protein
MIRFFPVLGDQLSLGLPSLARAGKASNVVLMMEVREEATTPRHHKKKIAFLLSAMRHFAAELRAAGWRVDCVTLDDPRTWISFGLNLWPAGSLSSSVQAILAWRLRR